jgi:hypothetical protein
MAMDVADPQPTLGLHLASARRRCPFTRSWYATKRSADAAVRRREWVEQVDR